MIPTLPARVRLAEALSPRLRRFVLEPAQAAPFPAAAPGAHVVVMTGGVRALRRAYSITDMALDRSHMQIIVRRAAPSRGGSDFLHDSVGTGDTVRLGVPQNLFPIPTQARAHLLLSAGIGVTPFLAYLPALAGTPAHLHHFCRPDEADVFRTLLATYAERTTIHTARTDLAPHLARQKLGTHISICGPASFMAAVEAAARAAGYGAARLHRETFAAAASGAAFTAVLARQGGRRVAVATDVSLLEALEEAGLDPPSLCRSGVCGQCRLPVRDGAPGDGILACVDRAAGPELVLDV